MGRSDLPGIAELNRPLPHSAEAERAILGSVLLDNSLVNHAIELLRPEDFYVRAHQFVFRAMTSLSERGSEIDPLLLSEELRREGVLEQAGGMTFISEMTYGLPHFTNVAAYAKVVKDHSLMRQGTRAAEKLLSEFYAAEDAPEVVLDRSREYFAALDAECERARGGRASLLTSFAEFMAAAFDDGEEIAFHARRGEVVLVQSVTNHGKSTLIRNTALALATGSEFQPVVASGEPRRVLLLNFEGSAGWFQNDLRVMTRDLTARELELIRENFLPTHAPLLDGEPLSLSRHMRVLEGAVRRAGGVDVLIVDTASAAFSIKNENDNGEIANSVMKPLVKLARRLNCLIPLIHHIGKAKAEEGVAREQAHRGRGASAWGDFSTSIFNLDADPNDKERVTVTCGKRKNGADYERVLSLDRETRWFKATDEATAKPATNDDLVLEAMERSRMSQLSTGSIEDLLAGKVSRNTVGNCLKRLLERGKVSKVRQGWWALIRICPSCTSPLDGWATCANCGDRQKEVPALDLAVEGVPPSNGNGFHKGVQADI
jgi:hypothetical protein